MNHFLVLVQFTQLRSQGDDELVLADLHCGRMGLHVKGDQQVIETLSQGTTHVLRFNGVQELLLVHVETQSMGGTIG